MTAIKDDSEINSMQTVFLTNQTDGAKLISLTSVDGVVSVVSVTS